MIQFVLGLSSTLTERLFSKFHEALVLALFEAVSSELVSVLEIVVVCS